MPAWRCGRSTASYQRTVDLAGSRQDATALTQRAPGERHRTSPPSGPAATACRLGSAPMAGGKGPVGSMRARSSVVRAGDS